MVTLLEKNFLPTHWEWDDSLGRLNSFSRVDCSIGSSEERNKLFVDWSKQSGRRDNVVQAALMALGCGIIFCPCAGIRLLGHYTRCFNPSEWMGIDSCFPEIRGYSDVEYTVRPLQGTGWSKVSLDKMCVASTIAYAGMAVGIVVPKMV